MMQATSGGQPELILDGVLMTTTGEPFRQIPATGSPVGVVHRSAFSIAAYCRAPPSRMVRAKGPYCRRVPHPKNDGGHQYIVTAAVQCSE